MGASGCQEVYEWYSRELHISLLFFHHLGSYYVIISFFRTQFLSKYSQSRACENVNIYGNVLGKLFTVLWPKPG